MLKLVHAFFCLLLTYTAWLQLNDPDPLFWCSLYLLAAAAPAMHLLQRPRKYRTFILGISVGFCFAGIAMAAHGVLDYMPHLKDESIIQDMSPDRPYIEETREFLGTLIALAIIACYAWLHKKNSCCK